MLTTTGVGTVRVNPNTSGLEDLRIENADLRQPQRREFRTARSIVSESLAGLSALPKWKNVESHQQFHCRHMDEINATNGKILDQFMSIFDMTPEDDRKKLVRESLLPKDWEDDGRKRSACPLHCIAFFADDVALAKIRPYFGKEDVSVADPLLNIVVAGIHRNAEWGSAVVTRGSAIKCAEIFIAMDPALKTRVTSRGTAKEYAEHVAATKPESRPLLERLIEIL